MLANCNGCVTIKPHPITDHNARLQFIVQCIGSSNSLTTHV